MSCSVAVCNSPVFSPSSSLFCNKPSSILSSPQESSLSLTLSHLKPQTSSPSSPSSTAAVSSPKSPFRLRFQKPPTTGFGPVPPLAFGSDSVSAASQSSSSPPGGALKRKRPTRLDIPIGTAEFVAPSAKGVVATTPREERSEVERDGDGYSVYCKRGRREAMEDRFSAITNLHGDRKQAIFGVYDGHGGVKAAEFAAKNLDKNVVEEVDGKRDDSEISDAVKRGYLMTDAAFLKEKDVKGGSCCVTALVKEGNLVVANAGDCRAVMSVGGVAKALSSDHRPSRDDEKKRIETTGGYVDTFHGVWRIQGSLAVSRGIGDAQLKKWVIAEPETKVSRIEQDHEFLILASDGLWDKVSNQEAVDIARPLCLGNEKPLLLEACKKLVDLSASRGSSDDISVMLIPLHQFM
ncbi:PREDICTED: probable protein phosphatase 2C 25 [Camelina sativa]|uniref:protein-serine/threonine phosphatase n=1 Tax=Camelina sativa TaxID=90675 RepID=A0ABM0WEG4_CAMSA|nr:PREDICTED: probable protein phosphatase 2C 25 [Camelina sativa]